MKIRLADLLVMNVLAALLAVVIWFADIQGLRIALGLPFILFFPGYAFVAVLFPSANDLGATQRAILAIAFSIIIAPFLGFIVNWVSVLELYPILVSVGAFIALMSVIALIRRLALPRGERTVIQFTPSRTTRPRPSLLNSVVTVLLAIALVGAIAVLGYVIANPMTGERFTEFYLVGEGNEPREFTAGDTTTVVVGIANREGEKMTYRVEVLEGDASIALSDPIEVDDGKRWEGPISFGLDDACAGTILAQHAAMTQPWADFKSTITVASSEYLEPGDHIWIGSETAQVESTEGNTVILNQGLNEYHPAGTEVTEVQRLEFRLHKIRSLGDEGEALLSLWVGQDSLVASVSNEGDSEARCAMEVKIDAGSGEEPLNEYITPVDLANGHELKEEIDFPFSETYTVEFSLYNHGELLYRCVDHAPYPSLNMWIHVKEGSLSS